MYTSTVFNARVRDAAAPYGGGWLERERFPAEGALRDLRHVREGHEALRIVARYCALRFVLLREAGAPPSLVDHARAAASDHLAVLGDGPEAEALRRLVEGPEPVEPALARLVSAARAAENAGHLHGAYAARRAACLIARRHLRLRTAAGLARGMASFLRRRGDGAGAARWERRAARLARPDHDAPPPSMS